MVDPCDGPTAVPTKDTARPIGMASSPMLLRWLHEGARTALLRKPRWGRLHAGPGSVLALLTFTTLASIAIQRLHIDGPASFSWHPLLSGWLATAVTLWVCYALRPRTGHPRNAAAPGTPYLFNLLIAQNCVIVSVYGLMGIAALRFGTANPIPFGAALWFLWAAMMLWLALSHALALSRSTGRKLLSVLATALILGTATFESLSSRGEMLWSPQSDATVEDGTETWLKLTQELMERQPQVLAERLGELQPQRDDNIDVYALTFAPYAHEDVFRRESAMVADVMRQRFDTTGRTLQLVNHLDTVDRLPWATPLNLERAIRHVATLMDKEQDVLFLHLTSHGASDGELAAEFWPMTVPPVTPTLLKNWLDAAGVRNRVISISACYSGSWIAPLADDHTLIMTAASAERTSYGCGRRSDLTFFGRAVFDEQLRNQTRSFEQALSMARPLIEQREQEAGKDDGYSDPQISVGAAIRPHLQNLRQQLEGDPTTGP
jgi:hypothetical protein